MSDSELISKITTGDYDPLFGDALDPIFVHQGETVGIYLTIKDPLRNHVSSYAVFWILSHYICDGSTDVSPGCFVKHSRKLYS